MGRHSYKDEIQVVKYLTQLSEPTFKFIQGLYDAGDKADKKWAVEQMIKLYGKAMPEAGDTPDNPIYQQVITGMRVIDESNSAGTTEERDRVSEQEPEANPGS